MICKNCNHEWAPLRAHFIKILGRKDARGTWESIQCPGCGIVQEVLCP